MMYIEKLIERMNNHLQSLAAYSDPELAHTLEEAATALSTLQAENEKLRAELEQKEKYYEQMVDALAATESAELEQVKRLYESEKEDFIDFACSGVPNLSPYCLNRHPDCVDERGWCRTEKCRGFSRERGQKEG